MYKLLLKPLFFLLAPERAHHFALVAYKILLAIPLLNALVKKYYRYEHPALERELFGLHFPNPVGLAAGFDKDGKHFRTMATLGFGFLELGTVTPKPQTGNPQPRLFRLPADEGLINRMGFNNEGVEALAKRLQRYRREGFIIGGNIGKNKTTPNEEAVDDYVYCFKKLFSLVDYFVVNVSSPNTPGLRALQDKAPLTHLLTTLQELNQKKTTPKPILLKIAPDLNESQLDDILDIARATKLSGLIATNTTISRENLKTPDKKIKKIGAGGLSGRPVRERSTEIIRYLYKKSKGEIPLIGVGGVASAQDAREKLQAGASLVQIYSGLIYEGPALIKKIKRDLVKN